MVRASKTKLQLANSLKDLMKKTSFRKITIQNVTDHCGLNRQTFYYHFKDMYDLLTWIYQNEIFREIDSGDDWESILVSSVKYAKKNRVFLRNTVRSLRKEIIERFLSSSVTKWVALIVDDACGDFYIKQDDRSFLIDFFTVAFVNYIIRWIGNGMPDSDAALLQHVTDVRDMLRFYEERRLVPTESGAGSDVFSLVNSLRAE